MIEIGVVREAQGVRRGSTYRHFKGGLYRVIGFAVDCTGAGGYLVLYQSLQGPHRETGTVFARSIDEWFQTMNPDENGLSQRRFEEHRDDI